MVRNIFSINSRLKLRTAASGRSYFSLEYLPFDFRRIFCPRENSAKRRIIFSECLAVSIRSISIDFDGRECLDVPTEVFAQKKIFLQ